MNKNTILRGCLLLVLAASVLWLGCPNDAEDDPTPAQIEASAFIDAHSSILGKTVGTVDLDDEAAVNAALAAYEVLDSDVKALLTTEKELLDKLKLRIDDIKTTATPQQLAEAFKSGYSTILGKTVDTVTVGDEAAVTAALDALDDLDDDVQALLTAEKCKLEDLKARIEELIHQAALDQLAENYRTDHAVILEKTVETVGLGDEAAVTAALDALDDLDDDVQALLIAEKSRLEDLKARIEELKGLVPVEVTVEGIEENSTIFIPLHETFAINRTFTATATGGSGAITYAWTAAGDTGEVSLDDDDTATVTVTPEEYGTVTITVTATDEANQTESFSFTVHVGIPIRFRERGPAAHNIDRPDIGNPPSGAQQFDGLVEVSVPSAGSSREFNGRMDQISGVTFTYLWESSDTTVATVHQITTAGFVTNNQDTFAIVTAVGEGTAQITLTVTATNGRVGKRSITFTVGDAEFDPNWHPYASRLITNLRVRDNFANNNAGVSTIPDNVADFFPHISFVQNTTQLQQFWFIRPDIQSGRRTYTDRNQNMVNNPADNDFTPVPAELAGSDWIRGPNTRGTNTTTSTPRSDHMEFRALVDIDVYLVYDSRASTEHADRQYVEWYLESDDWVLQEDMYLLNGEGIGINTELPATSGGLMHIRKRSYNANATVELGGSRPSGINVHFVVVKERTE